jgi:hypothetical protein
MASQISRLRLFDTVRIAEHHLWKLEIYSHGGEI